MPSTQIRARKSPTPDSGVGLIGTTPPRSTRLTNGPGPGSYGSVLHPHQIGSNLGAVASDTEPGHEPNMIKFPIPEKKFHTSAKT